MARRFRFRFSVRTLVILVTLVCAYFGAWEATKRYGPRDLAVYRLRQLGVAQADIDRSESATIILYSPRMPLIVSDCEGSSFNSEYIDENRRYYFWCFGFVAKLPIERRIYNNSPTEADLAPFMRGLEKGR